MRRSAILAAGLILFAMTARGAQPEIKFAISARKQTAYVETKSVQVDGVVQTVTVTRFRPVNHERIIVSAKTAVVVCDMWDDHWCKNAATRCAGLAKAADLVLKACRERGMTIIHCPSDCMDYYKEHAARKRMLAIQQVAPPKARDLPNPPLPVDDSDGGCDDEKPAKQFRAWKKQHDAIAIDTDRDYITDNGRDVYSLMAQKKIDTLIVMGVHTNMCVLNRTFAIKQMVKWGKEVYLVRDLTDAMYNPKMKPMVSHEKGTELIIEYIEANWCPTIESKQLVGK